LTRVGNEPWIDAEERDEKINKLIINKSNGSAFLLVHLRLV